MIQDDEAKQNIAANVQALMDDRGWKQADLARAVGESPMRISFLLRAQRLPSAAFLARLAEAFGTTTDRLLTDPRKLSKTA